MKQVFIILGIIAAVLSVILCVLPISNLAVIPAIAALLFGLIAYYLSRKSGYIEKIIPFTFLLIFVSLSVTVYKALFTKVEVTNTEELNKKEVESNQEAIQELEASGLEDTNIKQ